MMTVIGIMTKPAHVLAAAPVSRFVVLDNLGNALECPFVLGIVPMPAVASLLRMALSPPKYSALPKPVRQAEGTVPRHN